MSDTVLHRQKQVSPRMPGGWTREQWRELAKDLGVKRGRDTQDTINNIKKYLLEKQSERITIATEWAAYLYRQGLTK